MAGRGPAPKPAAERRNQNEKIRGEWQESSANGWQHGEVPPLPSDLGFAAETAWRTWFGSWFAAFWTPEDVPGLCIVIALYDRVASGTVGLASELRLQMDTYGITPKGQQDRRWSKPADPKPKPSAAIRNAERREQLKVV